MPALGKGPLAAPLPGGERSEPEGRGAARGQRCLPRFDFPGSSGTTRIPIVHSSRFPAFLAAART